MPFYSAVDTFLQAPTVEQAFNDMMENALSSTQLCHGNGSSTIYGFVAELFLATFYSISFQTFLSLSHLQSEY